MYKKESSFRKFSNLNELLKQAQHIPEMLGRNLTALQDAIITLGIHEDEKRKLLNIVEDIIKSF